MAGTKTKQTTAISIGADPSQQKQFLATRGQVLDRITTGLKDKQIGTRLKGKVGIVTGAGPTTGIGVSPRPMLL
jgi:hypothetical protein